MGFSTEIVSLDSYDSEGPHTPETDDSAEVKAKYTYVQTVRSVNSHTMALMLLTVWLKPPLCYWSDKMLHVSPGKGESHQATKWRRLSEHQTDQQWSLWVSNRLVLDWFLEKPGIQVCLTSVMELCIKPIIVFQCVGWNMANHWYGLWT